ncbi:hypothetical protein A1O3_03937 [Capronia epimyces CBS 606.96]|uniref:Uncharacterized protein n=1 Tax=Capronia epimyces CBS 606.96 TaxID=1182542 RepID=W9YBF7_9EURO|nr:uncharacterized protein A1O3_03937 [Capronia epimyces CBS 606.96]EXJ86980.1 hypothetical protein A1O3_03937 [Capronia epimyces CBS 606.96]
MLPQAEIDRLNQFHTGHFPGQPIPNLVESHPHIPEEVEIDQNNPSDGGDGLGYYEDGAKRTLTDEQIEMFRHSEIQRLLNERRVTREKEKKEEKRRLRKERGTERPGAVERRKRRFDDQPDSVQTNIDTLMYDDVQDHNAESDRASKNFMWPKIGSD